MNKRLDPFYMKIILYVSIGTVIILSLVILIFNVIPIITWIWQLFKWVIDVLRPLLWGILIAYLVSPLQGRIEKRLQTVKFNFHLKEKITAFLNSRRKSKRMLKRTARRDEKRKSQRKAASPARVISTIIASFIILGIIAAGFYGFFVTIRVTVTDVISNGTVVGDRIKAEMNDFLTAIENGIRNLDSKIGLKVQFLQYIEYMKTQVTKYIGYLPDTFNQIILTIVNLFFAIIFAFNILLSKEYFKKILSNFIKYTTSKRLENYLMDLCQDIDKVIKNYIVGYSIDLTLISFVTSIALWLAAYPYPFIIGIFAGVTNIIPYLGSWLGALPIVFVCILDGGLKRGVIGYFYILIVQQLYYFFITPRIQGEFVGIHPLFVLLSFIVFSQIFGLLGMILAVPLAGIAGVILIRLTKIYKQKRSEYIHKKCE